MSGSRRRFLRGLGLAPLGLVGCKVEPILDLPPAPDPERLAFPDTPPRIPDRLEDAEDTLQAGLDAFLAREQPYLAGELRVRSPEQPRTTEHLVALLQVFGLEGAGPRGAWLQDVELRLIEQPPDARPRVVARPEPRPEPESSPPPETELTELTELVDLTELTELTDHGAFRQRRAGRRDALVLTQVRSIGEPLPRETIAGRVVPLRVGAELDPTSERFGDQLEGLAALVRQSGAAGLLLLSRASDDQLAGLRERWRRQFRPAETHEADELALEGVLSELGSARLEAALAEPGRTWLLDADLGVRERSVTSHNVVARLAGRELPGEAVVLVCAWDTPAGHESRRETLRLLASLATFAELADWMQRSTRPKRSILVVFAVDAGLGAGQLTHARWAASDGVQPTAVLGFDRIDPDLVHPEVLLSGHFDARVSEWAERGARRDGRDLLLANELTLPSLAPYLRAPIPVLTLGVPTEASAGEPEGGASGSSQAGLHAEVRLVRNLLLALAERLPAPT